MRWNKLVPDQKTCILSIFDLYFPIRLKPALNAEIFDSKSQKRISSFFSAFKALYRIGKYCTYHVGYTSVKYKISAFTGKKYYFLFKIDDSSLKWKHAQNRILDSKNTFFENFEKLRLFCNICDIFFEISSKLKSAHIPKE